MADEKKETGRSRPAINPPGEISPADPGYLRQCGFALEPSIDRLIELAVKAGWAHADVVAAILIKAGRHLESAAKIDGNNGGVDLGASGINARNAPIHGTDGARRGRLH